MQNRLLTFTMFMIMPLGLSLFSAYYSLYATTPPITYGLEVAAEKDSAKIDPQLLAWIRLHSEVKPAIELNKQEFDQYKLSTDEVTRAFLELRFRNTHIGIEKTSDSQIPYSGLGKLVKKQDHPLFPYLLEEVIQSPKMSRAYVTEAEEMQRIAGANSCPRKELFVRDLNRNLIRGMSEERIKTVVEEIQLYSSPRFRREAIQALLDGLSEDKAMPLRDRIYDIAKDFPAVMRDNEWLVESAVKEKHLSDSEKRLVPVKSNASKQKCRTAKNDLIAFLKQRRTQNRSPEELSTLSPTLDSLDDCFSRQGQSIREGFWSSIQQDLKQTYGFRGEEISRRRLALLRWGKDDFEVARRSFEAIAADAEKEQAQDILANSIFTLARIEENNNKIDESLKHYTDFVVRFRSNEKHLDALSAMLLLNHIKGDKKAALGNAEEIIYGQSLLPLDQRNTSAASFALFWAGKLSFSLDQVDKAREYWKRVASEYYSTFYGAMGHYLLERLDTKLFVLSPSRTVAFNMEAYYKGLTHREILAAKRAQALLAIGFKEDAICELSELSGAENSSERNLVKALLFHAGGEWLSAIKLYDSLPRSFRNNLPSGFERILFPRSYVDSVADYSNRMGMDPDFIFAIIRQESVFNPKASSNAGAKGLMQLMPGTARQESKRLSQSYLEKVQRAQIAKSLERSEEKLFDADTNIALGVHHVFRLLSGYENNPVFVLTSYNANPGATQRWRQNLPTEDFLTFIERIPYAETKTYVKLVLRNYFYYKRWYQDASQDIGALSMLADDVLKLKK